MVSDPAKRATFTNSVIAFLQRYNFDGLDFDWEYPANRGGVPADKVLPACFNSFAKNLVLL